MIRFETYNGNITREEAARHPEKIYIFTDNTDRDSGRNLIGRNSRYYQKFGNGKEIHYPNQTLAILRGLDNAFPITTQKYYHEGAKGVAGRWSDTDEDYSSFHKVIVEDFDEIKREMFARASTGEDVTVVLPPIPSDEGISALTPKRVPRLYYALRLEFRGLVLSAEIFNAMPDLNKTEQIEDLSRAFRKEHTRERVKGLRKAGLDINPDIYIWEKQNSVKTAGRTDSTASKQPRGFGMEGKPRRHQPDGDDLLRERLKQTPCVQVLRLIAAKTGYNSGKSSGREHTVGGMYFSPFREEKSGSFHINENENVWYDHGGHKGGDVIGLCKEYLTSVRHMSSSWDDLRDEVYKLLAEASGLPAPRPREAFRQTRRVPGTAQPTFNVFASTKEGEWLSNLYERRFFYRERPFICVEQAFQYHKALTACDADAAQRILSAKSGFEAQRIGRHEVKFATEEARKEWDATKVDLMRDLVYYSFSQNPAAREALLKTGSAVITHNQADEPWRSEFPRILMETRQVFQEELIDDRGQQREYTEKGELNVGSIRSFSPLSAPFADIPVAEQNVISYAESCGISHEDLIKYCKYIEYSFREGSSNYIPGIFFPNSTARAEGDPERGEIRGLPYLSKIDGKMNPGIKMSYGPKEITILDRKGNIVPLQDETALAGKIAVSEGWKDMISFKHFSDVVRRDYDYHVVLNSTSIVSHLTELLEPGSSVTALLDNDKSGKETTEAIRSFCASHGDIEFRDISYLYRNTPDADFNQYFTRKDMSVKMFDFRSTRPSKPIPSNHTAFTALSTASGISESLMRRYGKEYSTTINGQSVPGVAFPTRMGGMVVYTREDPQRQMCAQKGFFMTDGISTIPAKPESVTSVSVFASFFDAFALMEWTKKDRPSDGTVYIILNEMNDGLTSEAMDEIKVLSPEKVNLLLPNTARGNAIADRLSAFCKEAGILVDNPGERIYGTKSKNEFNNLCKAWRQVKASRSAGEQSEQEPEKKIAAAAPAAPSGDQPNDSGNERKDMSPEDLPDTAGDDIASDVLSRHVVYSGGAEGADHAWGEAMGKYGARIIHYYYGSKTPHGNTPLSEAEYREGIEHVKIANKTLQRQGIDKYMPLLSRDWFQVKNAEAVVAIGKMKGGVVDGGTAWAVQMASDRRIPIYFFDQDSGRWVERVYRQTGDGKHSGSWIDGKGRAPVIPFRAALIGSRNLQDSGRKAISDAVSATIRECMKKKDTHYSIGR